jgi:hypothetical protein
MSELRTDTITASDGTSPVTLTKQEATKAHWLFEQANSNTLTVSLNVSGVVDNGTGDMTASYISAFSGAKLYSTSCTIAWQNDNVGSNLRINSSLLRATTSLRWQSLYVSATNGGGTVEDEDENSWQLVGDLA